MSLSKHICCDTFWATFGKIGRLFIPTIVSFYGFHSIYDCKLQFTRTVKQRCYHSIPVIEHFGGKMIVNAKLEYDIKSFDYLN